MLRHTSLSSRQQLMHFTTMSISVYAAKNASKESHHLITLPVRLEFVLEWKIDEHTFNDIRDLLSKAFEDLVNCIEIQVINEGNSIIVTCYAPHFCSIFY